MDHSPDPIITVNSTATDMHGNMTTQHYPVCFQSGLQTSLNLDNRSAPSTQDATGVGAVRNALEVILRYLEQHPDVSLDSQESGILGNLQEKLELRM